ncbi:hypothetical protein A0H81_12655 [Grifola frondosa]|uniref:Uncharacterized protein n=1 Tax=Grifola frondosa TaxID=5627 RepID=A0A1C7LRP5_GRIFR|nr:hypothetical protein A0H81_12655 [Grifola frondosa]
MEANVLPTALGLPARDTKSRGVSGAGSGYLVEQPYGCLEFWYVLFLPHPRVLLLIHHQQSHLCPSPLRVLSRLLLLGLVQFERCQRLQDMIHRSGAAGLFVPSRDPFYPRAHSVLANDRLDSKIRTIQTSDWVLLESRGSSFPFTFLGSSWSLRRQSFRTTLA